MAESSIFHPGICECCDRERDVVVAGSAFGPVSEATCRECLQKPAAPLSTFEYLYSEVAGGDEMRLHSSIKNWYTFKDGKYIHWSTFVHLKKEAAK